MRILPQYPSAPYNLYASEKLLCSIGQVLLSRFYYAETRETNLSNTTSVRTSEPASSRNEKPLSTTLTHAFPRGTCTYQSQAAAHGNVSAPLRGACRFMGNRSRYIASYKAKLLVPYAFLRGIVVLLLILQVPSAWHGTPREIQNESEEYPMDGRPPGSCISLCSWPWAHRSITRQSFPFPSPR